MYKNFIDNEFVVSDSADSIDLVSPVTEEVIATSPVSNQKDIDAAVAAAKRAFPAWRDLTPGQRQKYLLELAEKIEEHAEELADAQVKETGQIKHLVVSEECIPSADQMRFFAGCARVLNGMATGEYLEGFTSSIRREPIGVVAQVTPWNYPLMMAIWKIGPALAAGNTTVLKPSDTTPSSTLKLAELIAEVLPPGVVNIVLGDASTGAALVAHPDVVMVSITGSVPAGRAVGRSAGENLKRSHLELGGKAPVIVCADAELDKAAEGIAIAGLFNAGQDCTAATRVLVDASVADEFTEKLVAEMKKLKPGKPDDEDAFYGALNNRKHFDKVCQVLADLPEHAQIVTGGNRIGDVGFYLEPTVITGLKQTDKAIQEETFGPIITVQTFDTVDQALEMGNDVSYGLSASIWSTDHATTLRASRELDFGCVWINSHIPLIAEMPHGGFKDSGYGKDMSLYSVEEYTRIKHVMAAH
ncbi:MAG: gamma-aminobutyraldehyde dehydrogenase [Corynebacterium sp.]|uniref:NAD-dependent aldehyde dehydrogenase n=1 Tax=Corynebacterium mustelae TaxID=571915 RepID=A0A0G3H4G0_9CORY|nr:MULTISPECIES: gamma-aminobutyraldehyde dehydrogenase [Corynebacterium]AKK06703.1 NAD-dependent aldehyde dehydrogenase [Corynebacterium mustelae]MDO5099769.1 gamma-aminobutyraldehyde dehydrogenase [Corynebacterium sp.]